MTILPLFSPFKTLRLALAGAGLLLASALSSHGGTLDHFTWDTVPSSSNAGTPFSAQLTARDSSGNAVTSASGSVPVTAASGNSPIIVTEVQMGGTGGVSHEVEIQNVSGSTVTTTGWYVVFGDQATSTTGFTTTYMNMANSAIYYLTTNSATKPTGSQTSTLAAGALQIVNDATPSNGGNFSHLGWSNTAGSRYGWVAVFDSTNTLRDFVAWGWTAANLASFGITVNSQAITLGIQWTGTGYLTPTTGSGTGFSMQRTGTADTNTAADWSWVSGASFGTTNTGLTLPFTNLGTVSSAGAVSVALSPTSVSLANGVFNGNLTITPSASVVALTANDGSGHTGTSTAFAVGAALPLSITTTSPLNAGTTGTAYTQTLAATGGTGTYTWSVSAGTPPSGLALSSAGVLSGTPTAAGTSTFTARVTDSGSNTTTLACTITIYAPSNLTISTTSPLTAGTVGTAYSQTLAATSGTTPYTWTVSSGSLPGGLSLSTAGVLSGTPTAAGTFTFTARVADSANGTATKSLTVEIFLATSANGIGIPSPIDTTTYSATDPTTGATVQVPMGMVYVPSGSFTYGPSTTTPVVAATSVTLNGYCVGRFQVTNAEFLAFITATGNTQYIPSTGVTPTAYWVNGTYPAGKGNYPVNFVSLSAAKAYASWVSQKTGFNVIVPTAYQIEKATRGPNGYTYPWGNTAGATYVNKVLTANFNFNANVTSYYLNTLNTAYSLTPSWTSASTVTFTGGGAVTSTTPYYGNPVQYSTSPYNYYPNPMTVSSIVSISNAATPVVTVLTVSSTGGVSGYVDHNTDTGFIYTDLFAAINNAGGYTTAVGSYPSGVSGYGAYDMAGNLWNWTTTLFLAANGAEANATVNEVRGGSWYATSSSCVGVDSGEGRADGDYNSVGFRIAMILPTTANNLSITSAATGEGVVNTAYSQTLSATGDTAPYNWSVSSGTLPTGLSLTPAGVLSGTPTATGASTFVVQVTGSGGQTAMQSVTTTIVNALTITSTSPLAAGIVGTSYSQTLAASGGATPYSWSVSAGPLPAGLSLSSAGILSGTPTTAGTSNFTVQVTDSGGLTATQAFSVTISSAYSAWATSYGLTGTNSGASASYTNDGVANLLKFAFGTSPVVAGIKTLSFTSGVLTTRGAPTLLINSNVAYATFCRLDNYAAEGVTYTVQFTANLTTWANSSTTPTVLADDGQVQAVSVPYPALVNGLAPRFFRVSVTSP